MVKGVSGDEDKVHELETISPLAQSEAEIHHVEARRALGQKRESGWRGSTCLRRFARSAESISAPDSCKDNSDCRCGGH